MTGAQAWPEGTVLTWVDSGEGGLGYVLADGSVLINGSDRVDQSLIHQYEHTVLHLGEK